MSQQPLQTTVINVRLPLDDAKDLMDICRIILDGNRLALSQEDQDFIRTMEEGLTKCLDQIARENCA